MKFINEESIILTLMPKKYVFGVDILEGWHICYIDIFKNCEILCGLFLVLRSMCSVYAVYDVLRLSMNFPKWILTGDLLLGVILYKILRLSVKNKQTLCVWRGICVPTYFLFSGTNIFECPDDLRMAIFCMSDYRTWLYTSYMSEINTVHVSFNMCCWSPEPSSVNGGKKNQTGVFRGDDGDQGRF